MKIPSRLLLLIIIFTLSLHVDDLPSTVLRKNIARIQVIKGWGSWGEIDVENDIGLSDGIPDSWEVLSWGNARASYYLDEEITPNNSRITVIEKTSSFGGAAISQRFLVQPGSKILAYVLAKGDGGALQIQFRKDKQGWQDGGWKEIIPTSEWSLYKLPFIVPPETIELRLLLRATLGVIKFDCAYLGIEKDKLLGPNLVINPDFIQDGSNIDPLTWWKNQSTNIQKLDIASGTFDKNDFAYLNVIDMSSGNYDAVKQRVEKLGEGCASIPEATSFLLALAKSGSDLQKERYYQLAIELAPNCPQAYAALAKLYASNVAFKSAADLYRKASDLSRGTILAGRYAFEEGFIHVRYTGKIDDAISCLVKANEITGWDESAWHRGAAYLFLGYAFEAKGMYEEAIQSFLRVVECDKCEYHHEEAIKRLEALNYHPLEQ
ncbi:MAG: hypothetical protein JXB49_00020 [Bacteroidales bacterium]|nr:hypothetical protein [Bacteroidales bacterium]